MESARAKAVLVMGAFLVGLCLSLWMGRALIPRAGDASARDEALDGPHFRYQRVICMSPAVAEIVFSMGAGPRVVGVSQHTKYPPEALAKPTCGGFFNPSFERIIALEPDLIIAQGEAAGLEPFAQARGTELVLLALSDLESIFTETKRVGKTLELEPEAALVCAQMRYQLAGVRAGVSRKPLVDVVLVVGREPGTLSSIQVVGPGTFLHDLIEVAGGRNVFFDLTREYAVISKEALLERAPEVVVELHGEGADQRRRQSEVRELWQGLAPLPAVQHGRVYAVEATYAMIPGPRVMQLAERLADLLHEE